MDIVALHEQQGLSPDEIVVTYPSLSLADVHAALAYYFDHREEIGEDLARDRQIAAELARKTPSRLQQKLPRTREG
jgi:uncharacterized protein (DUF433 family)